MGSLRVAVAQTIVSGDVPNTDAIGAARDRVLQQMADAADGGARVVLFPEGTLAYPSKRLMSVAAPELGEADWTRADWSALTEAVVAIQRAAAARGIWVVLGAPHRLSEGRRPHNSLYVIADDGKLVSRYDKRYLSTNEAAYLYTPGTEPVVVEIDGVRIGFALCLETLFPEFFFEYVDLGAQVVHVASAPGRTFGPLAQAHAVMTGLHIALAFGASEDSADDRSGICSMHGWLVSTENTAPAVVFADVQPLTGTHDFQRQARSGELYAQLYARNDPRTLDRTAL